MVYWTWNNKRDPVNDLSAKSTTIIIHKLCTGKRSMNSLDPLENNCPTKRVHLYRDTKLQHKLGPSSSPAALLMRGFCNADASSSSSPPLGLRNARADAYLWLFTIQPVPCHNSRLKLFHFSSISIFDPSIIRVQAWKKKRWTGFISVHNFQESCWPMRFRPNVRLPGRNSRSPLRRRPPQQPLQPKRIRGTRTKMRRYLIFTIFNFRSIIDLRDRLGSGDDATWRYDHQLAIRI